MIAALVVLICGGGVLLAALLGLAAWDGIYPEDRPRVPAKW